VIWLAFITGLVGSLHCAGMCGPIALSLPFSEEQNRSTIVSGRLLYNLGRVITYAIMGGVMGAVGSAIGWFGWQQYLSIAAGAFIILWVLLRYTPLKGHLPAWEMPFAKSFKRLFKSSRPISLFGIGFLNGFLPCGLVYVALAGAVATGEALNGAMYMAFFGLGTYPLMFILSLGMTWKGLQQRLAMRKLIPWMAAVIGILFIVRGMNLGIPYLSPKMTQNHNQTEVECCHPADNH
jgi:sulfite exporter TauE/SafE